MCLIKLVSGFDAFGRSCKMNSMDELVAKQFASHKRNGAFQLHFFFIICKSVIVFTVDLKNEICEHFFSPRRPFCSFFNALLFQLVIRFVYVFVSSFALKSKLFILLCFMAVINTRREAKRERSSYSNTIAGAMNSDQPEWVLKIHHSFQCHAIWQYTIYAFVFARKMFPSSIYSRVFFVLFLLIFCIRRCSLKIIHFLSNFAAFNISDSVHVYL